MHKKSSKTLTTNPDSTTTNPNSTTTNPNSPTTNPDSPTLRMPEHFLYILFFISLLSSCTSPSPRTSALHTIAEADSLDRQGLLYSDTFSLRSASNFLCSFTNRTEKAKAFYYLGRNYSQLKLDNVAVDCYIAADKLHPDDSQLRGRIYSNMAHICAQLNDDSLAVFFRDMAMTQFKEANDTIRYYSAILENAFSLCKKEDYSTADSLLNVLDTIAISTLSTHYKMIRAYYLYNIQKYDSALLVLSGIIEPIPFSDVEFIKSLHSLVYFKTGDVENAVVLSKWILAYSSNTAYQSSAYYILREDARYKCNIEDVAKYDSLRKDLLDSAFVSHTSKIVAVHKLKNYFEHKDEFSTTLIYFFSLAILILLFILIVVAYIVFERKKKLRIKQNEVLKTLSNLKNADINQLFHWNNEDAFISETNLYLHGFADKIKSAYPFVTNRDIKFCVLILLCVKLDYAAYILGLSSGGIKNVKQRLARKFGTQSSKLYTFLVKVMTK